MTKTYEGMFLLDNDAVRAGWPQAKSVVSNIIEKHGGKVLTSRRWDERKLAYPIRRRNRATYLLTHYEIERDLISPMLRDFEINETILRNLVISVDEVPEKEHELSKKEAEGDFVVPEPPADDAQEEPSEEPAAARPKDGAQTETHEAKPEAGEAKAEAGEVKPEAGAAQADTGAAQVDEKKED